jgi:hypothetical protein
MHPTLIELAGEVGGERFESRELSDAYLARSAGLPTLRISTTEGGAVDRQAFADVCKFTGTLLDRVDGEIGPLLG